MADFNSYIANYCARTGKDVGEVASKLESLSSNFRHKNDLDSIWETTGNEDLSLEDFSNMLDKGAGASLSDEDVELLYNVFNKDGEGGISYDELSIIVGSKGAVMDFKLWSVLNDADAEEAKTFDDKYFSLTADQLKEEGISSALKSIYSDEEIAKLEKGESIERKDLDPTKISEIAAQIAAGTLNLSDYESLLTKDSYDLLEAAVNDAKIQDPAVNPPADPNVNDPSDQAEPPKEPEIIEQQPTGDKSIDDMRTTIANMIANDPSITPEDVISQLDPDVHGQEFIDQLRASYNVYENESAIDTQWEIQKLNNPDITRLEVIEIMRNNGTLGKLVKDSTMPLNETTAGGSSATLSDDRLKEHTTRLWEIAPMDYETGLLYLQQKDYDSISEVLSGDLSAADIVNIVANMSPDEPGNWLWMLQESGNKEESAKLLEKILPKIGEEALAGNEKAIEILCNVLEKDTKGSTEGLFYVNHTILEQVFGFGDKNSVFGENADEVLAIIKNNYGTYNDGASLADHIRGEWMISDKDFYLNKLLKIDE